MSIVDYLRKRVEEKIDGAFGVYGKEESEPVEVEEVTNVDVGVVEPLDLSGICDSQLATSPETFEGIVPSPTYISREEVSIQDTLSVLNVSMQPSVTIDKKGIDVSHLIEEQCGCVLFGRSITQDENIIEFMKKKHMLVDKDEPNVTALYNLSICTTDDQAKSYTFVAISEQNRMLYNLVRVNDTILTAQQNHELQLYMTSLITKYNISQMFYVPYSLTEEWVLQYVEDIGLPIITKGNNVYYYFKYLEYNDTFREIGYVIDLTSFGEEDRDSLIDVLYSQMKGTLYPCSVKFFKVDNNKCIELEVRKYISDEDVMVLCNTIAKIKYSIRRLEV